MTGILEELKWESLKKRRRDSRLILFYKGVKAHPEIMQNIKAKDDDLISRMSKMRIEQSGPSPEMLSSTRKLPESRTKVEEPELAFEEPDQVPEGRVSITQLTEFINKHNTNKDQYTAKNIAYDYKLDSTSVESVLKYFKPLQLKINVSEQFKKEHKKLTKELKRQGYITDAPGDETPQTIDMKKLGPGKS